MGRKQEKPSEVLAEYFVELVGNKPWAAIARETGISNSCIATYLGGEVLPKYHILLAIFRNLGQDKEAILELAKKDPLMKYTYWNELYPGEDKIENIRFVIKKYMKQNEIMIHDVCEECGLSVGHVSNMLNGKVPITYSSICHFANYFKMSPDSLIEMMRGREDFVTARKEFTDYLKKAREISGYSAEEVAKACNIPKNKYIKIEEGECPVQKLKLAKICRTLHIKAEFLIQLAERADLIPKKNSVSGDIRNTADFKNAFQYIRIMDKADKNEELEECLVNYARMNKIYKNNKTYKASTIITLIIMCLDNRPETGKLYDGEIFYYLRQLENGNDAKLYRNLSLEKETVDKNMSIPEVFEYYKNAFDLSYADIAERAGLSKGYVSNMIKSGEYSLKNLKNIMMAVNVNYSYIIELYLKEKTKGIKTENEIYADVIQKELSKYENFNYDGKNLSANTVCQLIDEIYYTKGTPTDKYIRICKIVAAEEELR